MKLRVQPEKEGKWYWSLGNLTAEESRAAERERIETYGSVSTREAGRITGQGAAREIRKALEHFAMDPLEMEV